LAMVSKIISCYSKKIRFRPALVTCFERRLARRAMPGAGPDCPAKQAAAECAAVAKSGVV
jgi:hypothetical protein